MTSVDVKPVLMVIHAPGWGGIHGIAERIAPACAAAGFPWVVVLPQESDPECRERLQAAGIEVVLMPLRRIRKTRNIKTQLKFFFSIPIDIFRLSSLIQEHKIVVVMVGGAIHFHGALAAKLCGRRLIWQIHSDQPPRFLRRFFTPWIVHLADAVMTSGEMLFDAYPGLGKARTRTIGFRAPVDTAQFRPDPAARVAARRDLGIGDDEIVVGTVGGRGPNKNHEQLLAAVALASKNETRLRPLFCGGELPQHEAYYRRHVMCPARARWPGKTLFVNPHRRVSYYLNAFDIFCLPSRGEGASLVIAEAMATALPVVANEVGAIPDSVINGKTGWLVKSSTAEEMARHISRLAADRSEAASFGAAGRVFCEAEMSIAACTEQHILACELALSGC